MAESKSLRVAYGEALAELGAKNDKIVVMDADLAHATMTNMFQLSIRAATNTDPIALHNTIIGQISTLFLNVSIYKNFL